jgi:hypothetical protein
MPLSDYFLDTFIAPKLSLLTKCGAPELVGNSNWLNSFILNATFVSPIAPSPRRTSVVAFLRRAEAAFLTYRKAREQLNDYLRPRPERVFSLYFESLLYFETCLSQWTQGVDILRAALGANYFQKDDQSKEQRINRLYNDTKHLDEDRAKGEIVDEMATIWITNEGLEGCSGTPLSFVELHDALLEVGRIADELSTLGMTKQTK